MRRQQSSGWSSGHFTCLEVLPNTTGVSSGMLMDGLHLSGCIIIPHRMLSCTSFHFILRVLWKHAAVLGPHFYWRGRGSSGSWCDLCEIPWFSGRTRTLCTSLSTGQRVYVIAGLVWLPSSCLTRFDRYFEKILLLFLECLPTISRARLFLLPRNRCQYLGF